MSARAVAEQVEFILTSKGASREHLNECLVSISEVMRELEPSQTQLRVWFARANKLCLYLLNGKSEEGEGNSADVRDRVVQSLLSTGQLPSVTRQDVLHDHDDGVRYLQCLCQAQNLMNQGYLQRAAQTLMECAQYEHQSPAERVAVLCNAGACLGMAQLHCQALDCFTQALSVVDNYTNTALVEHSAESLLFEECIVMLSIIRARQCIHAQDRANVDTEQLDPIVPQLQEILQTRISQATVQESLSGYPTTIPVVWSPSGHTVTNVQQVKQVLDVSVARSTTMSSPTDILAKADSNNIFETLEAFHRLVQLLEQTGTQAWSTLSIQDLSARLALAMEANKHINVEFACLVCLADLHMLYNDQGTARRILENQCVPLLAHKPEAKWHQMVNQRLDKIKRPQSLS